MRLRGNRGIAACALVGVALFAPRAHAQAKPPSYDPAISIPLFDFAVGPDDKDKCPLEPETINGVDDWDGCPDQGGVQIANLEGDRLTFLRQPTFKGGALDHRGS